jgi:hypothetical protein
MRVDLLYHYVIGQGIGWFNGAVLHLNVQDNAILSTSLMVGKELTDTAGFDVLDLAFGVLGFCTQVL